MHLSGLSCLLGAPLLRTSFAQDVAQQQPPPNIQEFPPVQLDAARHAAVNSSFVGVKVVEASSRSAEDKPAPEGVPPAAHDAYANAAHVQAGVPSHGQAGISAGNGHPHQYPQAGQGQQGVPPDHAQAGVPHTHGQGVPPDYGHGHGQVQPPGHGQGVPHDYAHAQGMPHDYAHGHGQGVAHDYAHGHGQGVPHDYAHGQGMPHDYAHGQGVPHDYAHGHGQGVPHDYAHGHVQGVPPDYAHGHVQGVPPDYAKAGVPAGHGHGLPPDYAQAGHPAGYPAQPPGHYAHGYQDPHQHGYSAAGGLSASGGNWAVPPADYLRQMQDAYQPLYDKQAAPAQPAPGPPAEKTGNEALAAEWERVMSDFLPDMIVTFKLSSGESEHFHQDVGSESILIRGGFFESADDSASSIKFQVISPSGKVVYQSAKGEGLFKFQTEEKGTYTFALSNGNWSGMKYVTFVVGTGVERSLSQEEISTLDGNVKVLYRMLGDMETQSTYLWLRQKSHLENIKSMATQTYYALIVELVCTALATVAQLSVIKKMVSNRRLF